MTIKDLYLLYRFKFPYSNFSLFSQWYTSMKCLNYTIEKMYLTIMDLNTYYLTCKNDYLDYQIELANQLH